VYFLYITTKEIYRAVHEEMASLPMAKRARLDQVDLAAARLLGRRPDEHRGAWPRAVASSANPIGFFPHKHDHGVWHENGFAARG
jgi:hypothetical protein